MRGQEEVRFTAADLVRGTDEDGVADNGGKAVDLSAELDLDNLALLQGDSGFLGI